MVDLRTFTSYVLLLLGCFVVACNTHVTPAAKSNIGNDTTPSVESEEPPNFPSGSLPSKAASVSEIKWVSEVLLDRYSESKDENGWMTRPYFEARIVARFDIEPDRSGEVTIVPLDTDIPSFRSKIRSTAKKLVPACKVERYYWSVDLEPITTKAVLEVAPSRYHNDQRPFTAFILYPAVYAAEFLERTRLTGSDLPKGVSRSRVSAAIDLDNDSRPELLSVLFCCDDPSSAEDCPYLCSKYYRRVAKKWEKGFSDEDLTGVCE